MAAVPITKRKCRVCGKEYEACRTTKNASGGFNWREVACSPECGEQYLHSVLVARGVIHSAEKEEPANTDRKHKSKDSMRYGRPAVVADPATTDDAVGCEAPAVSVDAADDTVADDMVDESATVDADSEW